jgi:hypothetical protein
MQIALRTSFAASRKEPLGEVVERIHAAIVAGGAGEPAVRFSLSDSPVPGGVSSIDRVVKRFPQFEHLVRSVTPPYPGAPTSRVISSMHPSGALAEAIDFATLVEVARGVPRSFPFHGVAVRFSIPAMPEKVDLPALRRRMSAGIEVLDSWWVNGRNRSVTALTIVEAEAAAKTLPPLPDSVTAIFAACGKVKKTSQVPLPIGPVPTPPAGGPAERLKALQEDYRAHLPEIVERAGLPHDLPSTAEARAATGGERSGPRKPGLVRAFTPLGYDCRGDSGTFTLRRRTGGNLGVELYLDVGTWSNEVGALFFVQGLIDGAAFKMTLALPVTAGAGAGQYPIGGPEQWRQIVENLATLTAELDRSFVPAVEAESGPSPDWYKPFGG